MAYRTIVAVFLSKLACMSVFVTINTCFFHQFKRALERFILCGTVAFAAFQRCMAAVQGKHREIMIEIHF